MAELAARFEARQRQIELAQPPKPIESVVAKAIAKIDRYTPEEMAERARRGQAEHETRIRHEMQSEFAGFINQRGKRYADCRLGNFNLDSDAHRKAVELLTDYAENVADRIESGTSILFIGPPGTGKDHLMTAICRAAILGGKRVMWANGQDLWGSFRDAISEEANETTIIQRYVRADVLAISDPLPPRGALSDFQASTLFRIIDGRYSNMRPTWMTLNVTNRAEAGERIGHQTIDRLAHGAVIVGCNWPSYRQGA